MDDNLIKPVDGQSIFSIKSAKDKNLNDKKKRQNTGQNHSSEENFLDPLVFPNEEAPEEDKNKNGLDFCA
ncbi:MAG: hypothetical protein ABFD79_11850 [Phycisphaerales bacterium]